MTFKQQNLAKIMYIERVYSKISLIFLYIYTFIYIHILIAKHKRDMVQQIKRK